MQKPGEDLGWAGGTDPGSSTPAPRCDLSACLGERKVLPGQTPLAPGISVIIPYLHGQLEDLIVLAPV